MEGGTRAHGVHDGYLAIFLRAKGNYKASLILGSLNLEFAVGKQVPDQNWARAQA